MPHWDFGCPSTWVERPKNQLVVGEVEAGLERTRPRYTRQLYEITASWILRNYNREAGYFILRNFYVVECKNGTLAFSMVHPWTSSFRMYKFKSVPDWGSIENKWATQTADLTEVLHYVPTS